MVVAVVVVVLLVVGVDVGTVAGFCVLEGLDGDLVVGGTDVLELMLDDGSGIVVVGIDSPATLVTPDRVFLIAAAKSLATSGLRT